MASGLRHIAFLYIGEGGAFLNLDSSILYIHQHHLLKQPSWIKLLNIFLVEGGLCDIYFQQFYIFFHDVYI